MNYFSVVFIIGERMENTFYCSFCGRGFETLDELFYNVDGSSTICYDCLDACMERREYLLQDEDEEKLTLLRPQEIKAKLDEYIIGQDEAKKVLSVAVYNHYKRINYSLEHKRDKDMIDLDKSNVLLIGPTGSGKTLLAKTLARILDVPFAQCDATTLTEAGYVGEDVENILLKLIQNAEYDIKKAQRGIIYIDEIDKLRRRTAGTSITRDVSGEGVQQALLKIIESTVASVPPQGGRKNPTQEMIQIDTTNILFICGGAFVGLEDIISKRTSTKQSLGFGEGNKEENKKSHELIKVIQPEDLIGYGLIPEFVGRIPVVVGLDELDQSALVRIMNEPKNAIIKQYKTMFSMDGVEVEFTDDAIASVAKKSIELKTGARGLRQILEESMLDIMYDIPSTADVVKIVIDKEVIEKKAKPKLIKKQVG